MTTASFVVRALGIDDANAVAALYQQSVQQLIGFGSEGPFAFNADVYRRDGFGSDPAFAGIGVVPVPSRESDEARSDAELAAYLLYTFGYDTDRSERHLVVLDLLVDERHRSLGAGAMLMDAARRIALERGVRELSWRVHIRNTRGVRFYARLGAHLSEEIREMHWVPPEPAT